MDQPSQSLDQMQKEQQLTKDELDRRYPNRPRNHGDTLAFHALNELLFNPLSETKKRPTGPVQARKKLGPHGPSALTPHDQKRNIINNFFAKWRREVGNDIYPAFRLLLPDKDKERAMYGLKEKTIAKLLVRLVKINKDSEDAVNLLNWRLPGQRPAATAVVAGDFAGRCQQVLAKRATRTTPGDMTIQHVNDKLDELSLAQKEDKQLAIMQEFYLRMNVDEMTWLIRIILRQMKIGATEKTFFDLWHPDADTLFNISSSLRRVCWELADPQVRLPGEDTDITLMSCFQPQLAQFQPHSFEKLVQRLRPIEEDNEFWIEEKLDGERMQLHMAEDDALPGGKRFGFWSRKAKDYAYLYGSHFEDDGCALTKYLKTAFHDGVRNIILDGEMITWDPVRDKIVPFGTLKTAALNEKTNAAENRERPFYRVFDILYVNDNPLTKYTLRDRRQALEQAVRPVHRRLDILPYTVGHSPSDIEPQLREIVAEASEGLVLKNPRSMYRLNDRNDDWMKVKPEYMSGFGQDLDCLIIGGYWGSGRRGGFLSSFMCGLRAPNADAATGDSEVKFWSFCKVGGGFSSSDYATIRHHTEGKWHDWDQKNPPSWIELAPEHSQREQPDTWISPADSLVISIKAASVTVTKTFKTMETLRFPRLKALRPDRNWTGALTYQEFLSIRNERQKEQQDKQFLLEQRRRQQPNKRRKKEMTVAGAVSREEMDKLLPEADIAKDLFDGLTFFVLSESVEAPKKSKAEIEAFVKAHGGKLTQTAAMKSSSQCNVICVADRRVVKVSSLMKQDSHTVVRPRWLYHCVEQAKADISKGRDALLIPYEPRNVLYVSKADQTLIGDAADEWSDSYARDITDLSEMRQILDCMPSKTGSDTSVGLTEFRKHYAQKAQGIERLPGHMFENCVVWCKPDEHSNDSHSPQTVETDLISNIVRFGSGTMAIALEDFDITHVVMPAGEEEARSIRRQMSSRQKVPYFVTARWVFESWSEQTLLDEDRFKQYL